MIKSLHSKHNDVILSLLRDRREALGMRRADLAESLGQTQAMISRVEIGERRLDIIELRAWLKGLAVGSLPFMRAMDAGLRDLPEVHPSSDGARSPFVQCDRRVRIHVRPVSRVVAIGRRSYVALGMT